MRQCMRMLGLASLFLTLAMMTVQAQDAPPSAERVRIELRDGSRFVGTILAEDETTIRVQTDTGVEMTIPRAQVSSLERLGVRGGFSRPDPNKTRLLFAPTARSLRKGQGYLAVYEIFFPFAAVGVGDIATLAGGFSLIPGLDGQLIYGAPKLTVYQSATVGIAAGGIIATTTSADGSGGLLYGVGTLGSPDKALTLGVGFAFGNGEFEESPLLLIGGEYRVSNRVKLLSENYVLPALDNVAIVSGGIRFIGDNLAADFGFFTSPDVLSEGGFPLFPWLSFAYNFGPR